MSGRLLVFVSRGKSSGSRGRMSFFFFFFLSCSLLFLQFAPSPSTPALCVPTPYHLHRKSSTRSLSVPSKKRQETPPSSTQTYRNEIDHSIFSRASVVIDCFPLSFFPSLFPSLFLPRQLRKHQLLRELVRGVLVLDDVLSVVGDELVELLGRRVDRRGRRLGRGRGQGRRLGADGGGHNDWCVLRFEGERACVCLRFQRSSRNMRERELEALLSLFFERAREKKWTRSNASLLPFFTFV